MEVVIIGGSLSGLTLALACARHGIPTQILERAIGHYQRGGALGVDRDLLMRVIGQKTHEETDNAPFPVLTCRRKAISWQSLHDWLRGQALRRAEITLTDGVTVSRVMDGQTAATVLTTAGQKIKADLIVGADGYRSIVRRSISPRHHRASYAGYLLWRGLIPEASLPPAVRLPQNDHGIALVNKAGYRLIACPVAGMGGSPKIGERLINFAWYDAGRENLLRTLNCLDSNGEILASIDPENIPANVVDELHDLARRIWPNPWRAVISHALEGRSIFATPVAEYLPDRLQRGRLAILGDAAHVASPAIGMGFIAGTMDAESLAGCLGEANGRSRRNILSALKSYETDRLPEAQALVAASVAWSRSFLSGNSIAGTRTADPFACENIPSHRKIPQEVENKTEVCGRDYVLPVNPSD